MMPLLVGCLDMTQEHEMAQLLAKKESFGGFCHTEELRPLTDSIRHNDFNRFCFLLLNRANRLSFNTSDPEHDLLWEFCILELTPERLDMITTLFDPNQFGARSSMDKNDFPRISSLI